MNPDEILTDLKNKAFFKIATNIRKVTEIEQFTLNEQWTDYLQTLIDYGNNHLLRGIQYRLIMEV